MHKDRRAFASCSRGDYDTWTSRKAYFRGKIMANAADIAKNFVQHYYTTFDASRDNLAALYVPQSTMTFEGSECQGVEAIAAKLKALPFQTVAHVVTTIDAHLTIDGGLIVFVIGQLKADNDPPHSFSQAFHLKQNPETGSFVVLNDIFRLMLHHG